MRVRRLRIRFRAFGFARLRGLRSILRVRRVRAWGLGGFGVARVRCCACVRAHRRPHGCLVRRHVVSCVSYVACVSCAPQRIDGLTGVWVDGRKVAAIGVKVSMTYHELACYELIFCRTRCHESSVARSRRSASRRTIDESDERCVGTNDASAFENTRRRRPLESNTSSPSVKPREPSCACTHTPHAVHRARRDRTAPRRFRG